MACGVPTREWSDECLKSDDLPKKELIKFLQDNAAQAFLLEHKLMGSVNNVAKTANKGQLIVAYAKLFESQQFKGATADPAEEVASEPLRAAEVEEDDGHIEAREVVVGDGGGPPKFTKTVLKKGDKTNYPKKGETVSCWYTGSLEDGTVFDTNVPAAARKKKQSQPFRFKVGAGLVIRGWEEGVLTMSRGETARLDIEPEWAYGRKGRPDAKIPPNAKLVFEVELVAVD